MNPPIYDALWLDAFIGDNSHALIDAATTVCRDDVELNTSAFEAASVGWWPETVKAVAA